MRWVPGSGWDVVSADGVTLKKISEAGAVYHASDELVGTQEAAAIVGVRPPNFVRDWASRPDFPAPVGVLSSGRVWRATEVRDYVIRRRRPKPSPDRLAAIARRVAWWDDPERTEARPSLFIARVLARGSTEDVLDIEAQFGRTAMRRAVREAPAGVLGDRARNYWQLVLDLPREPAPPVRTIT
jgi:hypothetical protein